MKKYQLYKMPSKGSWGVHPDRLVKDDLTASDLFGCLPANCTILESHKKHGVFINGDDKFVIMRRLRVNL